MSEHSSDAGGGVAGAEEVALVPMDQKPPAEMPAKGGGTATPAQTTPAAAPAAVDPDTVRQIKVNDTEANAVHKFRNNKVSTAKYTIITFIPKNLWEQFHRAANVYFLIIALLQQIPGLSPTGRTTTIIPLMLVLGFTALKEAVEDWKRHRADDKTNNSEANVLRGGVFVKVKWKDIMPGDVVKVLSGAQFPADLLLLNSSEPLGMSYIETANLDGETNLKIRQAITETTNLQTENQLVALDAKIVCEKPNNRLYNFDGYITISGQKTSLTNTQILLRGAVLKNTTWIFGVAVFTGHDSKLMQNANKTPSKRTQVEKFTNKLIGFIFVFLMVLCTIASVNSILWAKGSRGRHLYLAPLGPEDAFFQWLGAFVTFFILFNNLIPISLYVSMEMVKFFQAQLINNDLKLYYPDNNTPALARTSNLNEELGQVEYIFSDKTGTLTRNMMEFRKCTIAGKRYGTGTTEAAAGAAMRGNGGEGPSDTPVAAAPAPAVKKSVMEEKPAIKLFNFEDPEFFEDLAKDDVHASFMDEFLSLLAVCHTVIPEVQDDGSIEYQAASPDEGALVTAAKVLGYNFHTRTPESVTVSVGDDDLVYQILNVLEFNSTRKRMSVIARTPDGTIKLYCKGADTVIYERLAPDQPFGEVTLEHLESFAEEGLRTLCLGVCELTEDQYRDWNVEYEAADTSIIDRKGELMRVAELIERDLHLIGATAIEDKLQTGVPETIATLARAGIKIWVLTGDKQETAINIGFACRLLTNTMQLLVINEDDMDSTVDALREQNEEVERLLGNPDTAGVDFGLIIDGNTLTYALEDSVKMELLKLATKCKAVVACRVSPLQKALIVKLVKDNVKVPRRPITLAIGDGANDVSMIQAAHIGIGISGEEGLQAASSADYAVAQFKFLKRLLLVHGNWSYRRISALLLYSFYKNIGLYLIQFWFALYNGFSGQTIFEQWTIGMYNVCFTSLPVVVIGVLDQDLSSSMLSGFPQLYIPGQRNRFFNWSTFLGWLLSAIWHSVVVFFFVSFVYDGGDMLGSSGQTAGMISMGLVIYTSVVILVNVKLALEVSYWTWITAFSLVIMILNWFIFMLIYCRFPGVPDMYAVDLKLFGSASFWLTVIACPVAALLRDYVWKYCKRTFFPESYHIVQEMQRTSHRPPEIAAKTTLAAAVSAIDLLTDLSRRPKWKGFGYDAAPDEHSQFVRNYGAVGRDVGVATTDPTQESARQGTTRAAPASGDEFFDPDDADAVGADEVKLTL